MVYIFFALDCFLYTWAMGLSVGVALVHFPRNEVNKGLTVYKGYLVVYTW